MIMFMKKRELIELNAIFNQLKDFGGTKFKYSIIKNLTMLKTPLSLLEEIETSIKEILKNFDEDRNNLILELGVHDQNGGVYIDQSDEVAIKNFNERLTELIEKHKESIDAYNLKLNEYNEILNEEVDEKLNFRTVSIDQCPEEGITSNQLNKLLEFGIIE